MASTSRVTRGAKETLNLTLQVAHGAKETINPTLKVAHGANETMDLTLQVACGAKKTMDPTLIVSRGCVGICPILGKPEAILGPVKIAAGSPTRQTTGWMD